MKPKRVRIQVETTDAIHRCTYEDTMEDIEDILHYIDYFKRNKDDFQILDITIEDVNEERGKRC